MMFSKSRPWILLRIDTRNSHMQVASASAIKSFLKHYLRTLVNVPCQKDLEHVLQRTSHQGKCFFFPLEQACILTLSINSSFALGARTLRTLDNVKSCNNKFSWVDLPHKFYLNLCMYAKLYKVVHHKVS